MNATILKFALPVMAFALASAGAVTTKVAEARKADKLLLTGYIHVAAPIKCKTSVQCSEIQSDFCRVNGTTGAQVYNMDPIGDDCWQPLYRP